MKKSWSHHLFFWFNSQIGKRPWLDKIMLACAHWLIYLLAFVALSWGIFYLTEVNPAKFELFIKLLLTALIFAIGTNWVFSIIWTKRRPIVEFPHIKQLFEPYKTWKSFPSDHTTIAVILSVMPYLLGASLWFLIFCLILAILVGIGRIYAGVHYPRDIVGGIIVGVFFSYLSIWLLNNITQPVYSFFMNLVL